jgi:ATP-dependent Zn protease
MHATPIAMLPERNEAAIAYHESGHILMAHRLEVPFRRTIAGTIVPTDDYEGACFCDLGWLQEVEDKMDWSLKTDRYRLKIARIVQVMLGGITAQEIYDPSTIVSGDGLNDWDGGPDYHAAVSLLHHFSGSNEELEVYLHLLQIRTQDLLDAPHNRHALKAIAQALLQKKTLHTKEVKPLVHSAIQEYCDKERALRSGSVPGAEE